jgi:DNA-binding NtrC family response regulator
MAHVLVVDDLRNVRRLLAMQLSESGHQVVEAESGQRARELLNGSVFDLVITDLRLGDVDGLDVLRHARRSSPLIEVVVLTAYGTVESGVEAMKLGAADYLTKPVKPEELALVVESALERHRLSERLQRLQHEETDAVHHGRSAAWRQLVAHVDKVAPTEATVLLTGESGVGKEVVGQLIHGRSRRASHPMLMTNLGALTETLQESELFGHVKGAFTGAVASRKGIFMEADRGTLFLDEVGEAAASTQVALLRALAQGQIRPVGGDRDVKVDVRVIAATNTDLVRAVGSGRFREDLLFRLNVFPIHVPALRERREDIGELAQHLLARSARELHRPVPLLADDARAQLEAHAWPGNVRELQNVLERAVILHDAPVLHAEHVALAAPGARPPGEVPAAPVLRPLADVERDHVLRVLEACGGHRQKASEVLQIGRATLFRKLKEYGIGSS